MIDTDENDRTPFHLNPAWTPEEKAELMQLKAEGGFAACYKRFGKSRTPKAIRAKIRAEQRTIAYGAPKPAQLTAISRTPDNPYDMSAPRVDTAGRLRLLSERIAEVRWNAQRRQQSA